MQSTNRMRYFILAGEASGDNLGALLMDGIRALDSSALFSFWGGDAMTEVARQTQPDAAPGRHIRELAFMGFVEVVANLKSWIAGRTCIISTHRPAALELMDEIIILQNGRVSAKGEAKSVISKLSRPKVKSKPGGEKPSQENQAPVQPSHARSKTRMIQTAQIAPKVIGQTANGLHQAAK